MIFLTGDTHGRQGISRIFEDRNLSSLDSDDKLIILGDFGLIWNDSKGDRILLDKLDDLPFQILFVDGNHENHDMLEVLPQVIMFGGTVGKVRDSVFHLKRGEIYNIEGKSFFTMGGAKSIDRGTRVPGRSWWPAEMPSEEEYKYALSNLKKHGNSVDYILSHDCSFEALKTVSAFSSFRSDIKKDELTVFFDNIEADINFKHWYFGHYHLDIKDIVPKQTVVFKDIVMIK